MLSTFLTLAFGLGGAWPCGGVAQAAMVPGYPDNVFELDPREVTTLPRYCPYTQEFRKKVPGGNNQAEIDRWYEILGPTFHHMHHYCLALMKFRRAAVLARDPQFKKFYFEDTVGEINYVLERAPPDFILLPEMLTKKGEALLKAGKVQGIGELEQVIDKKPDYWPPYAVLSDYYRDTGNRAKAREILENALEHASDTQPIQRRLADLDRTNVQDKAKATAK